MTPSKKAQDTSTEDRSQDVGESIEDLGTAAADLGSEAKEQVSNLTDQVRQQATSQITSQKEQLVDTLETVALLLHQAGEHAQHQDKALIANYVDKAAQQVTTLSETLGQQDLTQVVQTTKDFARREPMLFVSGALAAGFLGARFLRSSTQRAQEMSQEQSTNGGGVSADASDLTTELPAYDIDQTSSASSEGYLGATSPAPTDTMTPGETGLVEDYESAVLEGDALGDEADATTPPDLEDLKRPGSL